MLAHNGVLSCRLCVLANGASCVCVCFASRYEPILLPFKTIERHSRWPKRVMIHPRSHPLTPALFQAWTESSPASQLPLWVCVNQRGHPPPPPPGGIQPTSHRYRSQPRIRTDMFDLLNTSWELGLAHPESGLEDILLPCTTNTHLSCIQNPDTA